MRSGILIFRKEEKGNKTRETVVAAAAGTSVKVPQKERSGVSSATDQSNKRSRNKDGIQLGGVMVTLLEAWWGQKPYWSGFTQKQKRKWLTDVDNLNSFARW